MLLLLASAEGPKVTEEGVVDWAQLLAKFPRGSLVSGIHTGDSYDAETNEEAGEEGKVEIFAGDSGYLFEAVTSPKCTRWALAGLPFVQAFLAVFLSKTNSNCIKAFARNLVGEEGPVEQFLHRKAAFNPICPLEAKLLAGWVEVYGVTVIGQIGPFEQLRAVGTPLVGLLIEASRTAAMITQPDQRKTKRGRFWVFLDQFNSCEFGVGLEKKPGLSELEKVISAAGVGTGLVSQNIPAEYLLL